MKKYHKIQSVFKRDPETKFKTFLEGEWARSEFEYLKDLQWYFTEKVDGTNIRVIWDMEKVIFKGKTDNAQIPARLIEKLQELFPVSKFKTLYLDIPMCLYGEGYGAKIQKGGGNYIPDGVDFILFDVMINDIWLERINIQDIAKKLKIKIVPIVWTGTLLEAVQMTKEGFKSSLRVLPPEGLVMKPIAELKDRKGDRIITKVKLKDFQK